MTLPIPYSTILVTVTSITLIAVTNLLTRALVDVRKERRMRQEVNAFNKELRQAVLSKDKEKEAKLRKKETQMKQMQAKASIPRLKVTAITIVPFFILYYALAWFLGGFNYGAGLNLSVAMAPVPIPVLSRTDPTLDPACVVVGTLITHCAKQYLPLFWWYFLSSLGFSGLLSKLMGTSPT
jgi:uncharacterized membrane protein (DUF106 family)